MVLASKVAPSEPLPVHPRADHPQRHVVGDCVAARVCVVSGRGVVSGTKIGSLFSGVGGLDLGVQQVIGGDVVWHVEFDAAPSKVLAHHWPDVPNYGDITAVDWSQVEPIDILTGGFPCQDVSLAGARAGMNNTTRSGLWAHYAHAISVLKPKLVVIENVRGLLSAEAVGSMESDPWGLGDGQPRSVINALGAVLGDLARLGYDTRRCGVLASEAGAPHPRSRVFIIGWNATVTNPSRFGGDEGDNAAGLRASQANGAGVPDECGTRFSDLEWAEYAPAIERWERILGRAAPPPTVASAEDGYHRFSPVFDEWAMGLPEGHVTNPAIGLTRNQQLTALGNGVVPAQCALALRMLGVRSWQ